MSHRRVPEFLRDRERVMRAPGASLDPLSPIPLPAYPVITPTNDRDSYPVGTPARIEPAPFGAVGDPIKGVLAITRHRRSCAPIHKKC